MTSDTSTGHGGPPEPDPLVNDGGQLTQKQLKAVHAWQQPGPTYASIQSLWRTPDRLDWPLAELHRVSGLIEDLVSAIELGSLNRPATLFRGIRDVRHVAGPAFSRPGDVAALSGFVATTLDLDVTMEFIPHRGGILLLHAPRHIPALHVSRYGSPDLAYQQELLLADGTTIEFVDKHDGKDLSTDQRFTGRMVIEARIVS